ncbi:lysophospholipid acyltransferase family protein [Candidatus Palauibacter sp.]|uniref:lysophospholipid acyltransferase family protein n=1 Tax=Candidatus Palauibacter sp. TaxID=3101350 RepID=UPI003B02A3A3
MNDREDHARAAEPLAAYAPGPVTRRLTPVTRWIITNVIAPPCVFLLFSLLNRTRIYGRRRIPRTANTLILSNHQSMIDSFPLAYFLFYPEKVFRPHLAPWNAAAQENFFSSPFLAWVFDQFKCIPVRRGRRDLKALLRCARELRRGTMMLFPEGTRSRDGKVGRGRAGAGMVILQTRPCVLPVTIDGMDRILPIGARFPRVGRRLSIYIGRPLDYEDLADEGRSREVAQRIVDRAMHRVRFQRRVLARLDRGGSSRGS